MELTRESILAMEAGSELDELIAVQVMGREDNRTDWGKKVFSPSTDISAAWEVVDQMNGPYGFLLQRLGDYFDEGEEWEGWEASFGGQSDRLIQARTAPEAICKCALLSTLTE